MKLVQPVAATFSMRATAARDADWRRLDFPLPAAERRQVSVTSTDPELAITLPDTIRQEHEATPNGVSFSGVLQPGRNCRVSWKPRVELQQEAELLLAGNPFFCDCQMDWLHTINTVLPRSKYPKVSCRRSGDRSLMRYCARRRP